MGFPPCPESLKPIAHYLKVAEEHDNRDVVISYWCRMHALDVALKITKQRSQEENKLLFAITDWLEGVKAHTDNEGITNKMCAQATVENYALKLFKYADEQDRAENYGKNVVKAFYTAGILMDVLTAFGTLSEDIAEKRKYAKWKAAYIHNCLKAGERPVPGPMVNDEDDDFKPENSVPPQNHTAGFMDFPNVPNTGSVVTPPTWNISAGTSHQPISPIGPGMPSGVSGLVMPPAGPSMPYMSPAAPSTPTTVTPSPTPTPQRPAATPTSCFTDTTLSTATIDPELITKAQKYCKWATSALNYDDVTNAIDNLQKALHILQTGKDTPE